GPAIAAVRIAADVFARGGPVGHAARARPRPGSWRAAGACPGQQSLIEAVTEGFGGGQLIGAAWAVPARSARRPAARRDRPAGCGGSQAPAAAAGRVPLRQLGSLHAGAGAAAGGTPLVQSGVVQAPAADVLRLSEPAARAAPITALAATRRA